MLVSTFVASTFTPAMTPPLVSVTRPVRVAVGPASRVCVPKVVAKKIRNTKRDLECFKVPSNFSVAGQSRPMEPSFCPNWLTWTVRFDRAVKNLRGVSGRAYFPPSEERTEALTAYRSLEPRLNPERNQLRGLPHAHRSLG